MSESEEDFSAGEEEPEEEIDDEEDDDDLVSQCVILPNVSFAMCCVNLAATVQLCCIRL